VGCMIGQGGSITITFISDENNNRDKQETMEVLVDGVVAGTVLNTGCNPDACTATVPWSASAQTLEVKATSATPQWRNHMSIKSMVFNVGAPVATLAQTCPFGQTTVDGVVQCVEEGEDSHHSQTFAPTGKHSHGRVYLSNTVDGVTDTAVQEGGLRQCGSDSWVLALNSDTKGNICAKMNKNGTLTEWKVIDPTISIGGWRGNKMMRIASLGVPDATTCDENTRFLYGYEQSSDESRWLVEVDGNCEAIESTRQDVTAHTTWPIYQDWVTTSEGVVVWITAWRKNQRGSIDKYFPSKSCTFPSVDAEGYRCSSTRGTLKPHTEASDLAKVTSYHPN